MSELLEQLFPRDISGWQNQWASGVFYIALLTLFSIVFGHFAPIAAAAFFYLPLYVFVFKRLNLCGGAGVAAFLIAALSPTITFGTPHIPGVLYGLAAMSGVWALLNVAKSKASFDLAVAILYLPFGFYSPQVVITSACIFVFSWLLVSQEKSPRWQELLKPLSLLLSSASLTLLWTLVGVVFENGFRVEYGFSNLDIFKSTTLSPYTWLSGGARSLSATNLQEDFYWSIWWPTAFATFFLGLLQIRHRLLIVASFILVSVILLTSDRSRIVQILFEITSPVSGLFRNVTYLATIIGSVSSFGVIRLCAESANSRSKRLLLLTLALFGATSSFMLRLGTADVASLHVGQVKLIENRFEKIGLEDITLEVPQHIGKSQATNIFGVSIMPSAMWMPGLHPVLDRKGETLDCSNVDEIVGTVQELRIEKIIYLGSDIVTGFDVSCFSSLKYQWQVVDQFSDGWVVSTGISNSTTDFGIKESLKRAANFHTLILYTYLFLWWGFLVRVLIGKWKAKLTRSS